MNFPEGKTPGSSGGPIPKVYIVVLNWNSWKDTLECLESIYRSDYPNYAVIVCDNDSHDGSLNHLRAWAEGRLVPESPGVETLRTLSIPPVPKPIPYIFYERSEAERGGRPGASDSRLILIQTGANLGFAGGNNVALRYAMARDDFGYVWLLNSDSVVRGDALRHLVETIRETPKAGICGSTILNYSDPEKIQALAGDRYDKLLGIAHHIQQASQVGLRLAYVMGASMLVSRSFLRDVGLLCEDYFLFFEELDWVTRARGRYRQEYAPESIVYHKGGTSTGSEHPTMSPVADFYMTRSQLLYVWKFSPWLIPFVLLRHLLVVCNSLLRFRFARIGRLMAVYFDLLGGGRFRRSSASGNRLT